MEAKAEEPAVVLHRVSESESSLDACDVFRNLCVHCYIEVCGFGRVMTFAVELPDTLSAEGAHTPLYNLSTANSYTGVLPACCTFSVEL